MAARRPPGLGLQLYTVRDAVAADLPGALRRVAGFGYAGVETLGTYGLSPRGLADVLDDSGLAWVSTFVGLGDLDTFAGELEGLADAGCARVVVPFLAPDAFTDRASISRAAELLSAATAIGADRGVRVGYHNHYWELAPVDGRPALERLFDEIDPRTIAEVDVYWAQVGGVDPAALVRALGTRVRLLHVKDGPAADAQQAMTAVGAGVVDIGAVLDAAAHAEWHVVELDQFAGDVWDAVEVSARYLLDRGGSRGAGRPRRAERRDAR
ncbi:MAG: xylose isomerase [Acidimicrobiia bacterium]